MIRVVVADDRNLVRAGFVALVRSEDDMTIVGEAVNGQDAVDQAQRSRPDVVLMDIRMPVLDGLEATRRICSDPQLTATRVLVVTTFDLDEYVYRALRAGASGFLLKDTDPPDLLRAIRVIADGNALIDPSVTRRLIAEFTDRLEPHRPPPDALKFLTPREREVMHLVAGGLSNDEIAAQLFISPLTAKTHVTRIITKLNCRDRAQLVVLAYETGLVIAAGQRRNDDVALGD
jgi:DNA-binding NarL/FixJ family response regulator